MLHRQKDRIDYVRLAAIPDLTNRKVAIKDEIANVGYVSITDAFAYRDMGGTVVLEYLEGEQRVGMKNPDTNAIDPTVQRTWKFEVLCDEFGYPPIPGKYEKWLYSRTNRDEYGNKLTSRDIAEMKRRGQGHKLETWHSAKIDEVNCIEVAYADAAILMDNWGVHYESNEPISRRKELGPPRKLQKNGQEGMRHTHNWRFREVFPDEYEQKLADHKKQKRKKKADNEPSSPINDIVN